MRHCFVAKLDRRDKARRAIERGPEAGSARSARRSSPRRGRLRILIVLALAAFVAACNSSGGSSTGAATPTRPSASTYFVSGVQGWTTKQPYKPRADDPISFRAEPTLDWSSQHERSPDPTHSQRVRLSGHRVSIANLEETMQGFDLHSQGVMKKEGRAGSGPDGPRVVLTPVSVDYTILTLSYELSLDELVDWSNSLRPVDEAGWVAAGGVIAR